MGSMRVDDQTAGALSRHDVSGRAADVLEHAQVLADRLRQEALAEAASLVADAEAKRRRAEETLLRAEEQRAGVEGSVREATAVLDSARADARAMLADAAAHGAAVSAAAERTAADLVATARADAGHLMAEAVTHARRVRQEAADELASARTLQTQKAQAFQSDLDDRRVAFDAQNELDRVRLESHAAAIIERTAQEAARIVADAELHASTLRRKADEAQVWGEADLASLRADAEAQARTLIDDAQRQAAETIAAAGEQLAWTRATVEQLMQQADAEIRLAKARAHDEQAAHIREVRAQLRAAVTQLSTRVEGEAANTRAEALQDRAKATAILDAAHTDAERTRLHAESEAARVLEETRVRCAAQVARAESRLTDAEDFARVVRERTTTDLERMQRDAFSQTHATREEAVSLLESARVEADKLRAEAHGMLERARTEVAALARRRADITEQLGHLRGVIEGLAVSGSSTTSSQDTTGENP
jgi:hypothetical protein